MRSGSILLAGFVGGILPYLLGMAKDAVSGAPVGEAFLYQNGGYWVGTLIFGAIGALVVVLLGEKEIRKAVAMGAAAPGFVLGLGQGGTGTTVAATDAPGRKVAVVEWLVATARAQQPKPVAAGLKGGDTLWVRVLGIDSLRGSQVDLVARVRHSPSGYDAVTYHLTPTSATIPVQRSATTMLFLVVAGARTDTVSISSGQGDTLKLRLVVRDRTFLSGLARAFGVRSVAARQPTVIVEP